MSCRHLCNQTLMYKPEEIRDWTRSPLSVYTENNLTVWFLINEPDQCYPTETDVWAPFAMCHIQRILSGTLNNSHCSVASVFHIHDVKTIRMCIYVISCGASITVNKSFNTHLRTWSCLHCCRTAVRAEHPSCRMPLLWRLWKGT